MLSEEIKEDDEQKQNSCNTNIPGDPGTIIIFWQVAHKIF